MMNRADVLAVFQRQYGVASIEQLLGLGVARSTIGRATLRGTLEVVLPGVYVVAGTTLSFEGRCAAALLYLGPDAFLAGHSAAALYGCRDMPRETVFASVPATARIPARPPWLKVWRSAWRLDGDVRVRGDGLRVSSPVRTIFDLASRVTQYRFDRVTEDMWHLKHVTPEQASDYLAIVRRSGRRGVERFERWLEQTGTRVRPAQSGLELDVIDAIRAVGLPAPERQHPLLLANGEVIHVDVAWPTIQFGLEPGHSWWHGGNLRMHADISRDNACAEVGWFIRRLEEDFRRDLPAGARLIKSLYDARLATFRPASTISPSNMPRK